MVDSLTSSGKTKLITRYRNDFSCPTDSFIESTIFEEFIHPPVWCWAISGIFLRERRAIESILEVIFGFKLERFAH